MKLRVENVSKTYKNQSIFLNLNFCVDEEIGVLTLIGPSGGGKSTFLRMAAGLESFEGEIIINGERVPKDEKNLFGWRKNNGFVFQSAQLFPHLNVIENIALPLEKVFHVRKEEAKKTAIALLEQFKLTEHYKKYPYQISGGQAQRISICRALAHNPKLLFLDEPTSALDPEMQYEVLQMIEELERLGSTIFLVTHHIPFAKDISDRFLFISPTFTKVGDTQDIFEKEDHPEIKRFVTHTRYL